MDGDERTGLEEELASIRVERVQEGLYRAMIVAESQESEIQFEYWDDFMSELSMILEYQLGGIEEELVEEDDIFEQDDEFEEY